MERSNGIPMEIFRLVYTVPYILNANILPVLSCLLQNRKYRELSRFEVNVAFLLQESLFVIHTKSWVCFNMSFLICLMFYHKALQMYLFFRQKELFNIPSITSKKCSSSFLYASLNLFIKSSSILGTAEMTSPWDVT